MKSHEKKIHVKEEHEAELERNDLNEWFRSFWTRLKSGELVTTKFALIALGVGVAIALLIYALRSGRTSDTAAWQKLESAGSVEALSDFAKAAPNTLPGKAARLQVARNLLGPLGVSQLANIDPAARAKAVRSIEEARESFTKLIDELNNDLTLQCQAIDGAAHAELALVGIPKEGTSLAASDYRGSVEKAIDLFRRYAKLAGETAGAAAKKMADDLEKKKAEVVNLGFTINTKMAPTAPQPEIKLPPSLTPTPK